MLVVHHPDQALHDPVHVFRNGKFIDQPDRAERYHIFLSIMVEGGHQIVEAPLGSLDPITAIHHPDYVEFLQTVYNRWSATPGYGPDVIPNVHPTHRMHRKPKELLGELGWYSNSTSCPIQRGTWPAVFASAQSAIHAADRLGDSNGLVYALCRPPGHHAYTDLMSGVCFLNNAAIAANRLVGRFGKAAIIDIDVHHGNGTQSIFWNRADVLVCSVHVDPTVAAPYYTGYADETGDGPGKNLTLNLPLPLGAQNPEWVAAIDRAVAAVAHYQPGALVISLGFDASKYDPVAALNVTDEGFSAAAGRLAKLGLPTLVVQEGGYINANLRMHMATFFRAFEAAPK